MGRLVRRVNQGQWDHKGRKVNKDCKDCRVQTV